MGIRPLGSGLTRELTYSAGERNKMNGLDKDMELPQPPDEPKDVGAVRSGDLLSGADLIAAERRRQIDVEGWSSEHDDHEQPKGQLLEAAVAYCRAARSAVRQEIYMLENNPPKEWPWELEWWKPNRDPIRNLVKAGALIAAEIDRLQRAR